MFCTNCGTENREDASFCHNCGANLNRQREAVQTAYDDPAPGYDPAGQRSEVHYGVKLQPELGMKWFKFIIYVQLFLNMLLQLSSAAQLFTGSHYGGEADYVYFFYDGLQAVDIIFGILSLGLVVMAFMARQALAKFKANGPKLYFTLLIVNIVFEILYLIVVSAVTGLPMAALIDASMSGQIIGVAILLGINVVYFRKRMHLFVN